MINSSSLQTLRDGDATLTTGRITGSPTCLTVMYHYVRDGLKSEAAGVRGLSVQTFADQIDDLCRRFDPVRWPDVISWLDGRNDIPERSLLLTFDDGLREHAEAVAYVLESRGLRGAFFVSSAPLVEQQPLTAHLLHALLDEISVSQLTGHVDHWCDDHQIESGDMNEQHLLAAARIYHYENAHLRKLKYRINYLMTPEDRRSCLVSIHESIGGRMADFVEREYMSVEAVIDLHRRGHTIGGHGHAHEPYAMLSPIQRRHDMRRCYELLECLGLNGRTPFSFPFGSVPENSSELCRSVGYAGALTTHPALMESSTDRYAIPRVDAMNVDDFVRGLE